MGIKCLETFIKKRVPDGLIPVDIQNEIRVYKMSTGNASAGPIIVIDFKAMFEPICRMDTAALLCGGRYECTLRAVDRFLQRLQDLGARLVFFNDGPMQHFKEVALAARHEETYVNQLRIIDLVDQGIETRQLVQRELRNIPNNPQYPLKLLARKHGEFRVAFDNECDKDIVTYANSVGALAVVSDDSDFLIFKGGWRYWSARALHFELLTTKEFNRQALVECLVLSYDQMPLFATLGGNDFIKFDELTRFHRRWGPNPVKKFPLLAEFVRAGHKDVVLKVFGPRHNLPDIRKRFQQSLDFYATGEEIAPPRPTGDPVADYLKTKGKTWMFVLWTGSLIKTNYTFIDLRENNVSAQFPAMVVKLVQRQAAIVLFHKPDLGDDGPFIRLCHKASSEQKFAERKFPVQFPRSMVVPCIADLLDEDQHVCANLLDAKLKLFCWMVSDQLDPRAIQAIPKKLVPTVATLYFLMEHNALEPFEADLLLKNAYDVAFGKYDPCHEVANPTHLSGCAFRVAFFYNAILKMVLQAVKLVGLANEFPTVPQFDGPVFHGAFQQWLCGEQHLDETLQQWRIYQDV